MTKGSEWKKWDLHVHSYNTKMNNQHHTVTFDEYLQALEDSDIKVFGITDYFNIETQLETIENFQKNFPDSKKRFFVNIEFRLDQNVSTENAGHVNVHLLFDPAEKRLKDFADSLYLTQTNDNQTRRKMSSLLENEFDGATIKLDEIERRLGDIFGNDKPYFWVMAAGGHGGIRPNGAMRNNILSDELDKRADFLFGSVTNTNYFLDVNGQHRYSNSIPKAVISASDAHRLERENEETGIGDVFTWIKAEPTLEGLRQIIFEPESRVAISTEKPEEKRPYLVIDHVTFKQNNELTSVYFNSNLNTIIGGRSNGKSTLTNSIAEALGNSLFSPHNDKSENSGMYSFINSDFKVYWQNDSNFDNSRDIEFIPQDYMIKLAEDDEARNKLVRSTIQSDETNYQLIRNYEQEVQENLSSIRQMLENLTNIDNEIAELEAPEGDKAGIESHLENIKQAIRKQSENENFKVEDQEKYQIAYNYWRTWENKRRLSNINLNDISYRKSEYIKLIVSLPKTDDSEYNLQLSSVLDELEKKVNQEWQMKLDLIEENQKESLANQEENVQKILKSSDYINGQNNIKNNELLKSLSEQQKSEISKLEAFKKFEADKNSLEKSKHELQTNILKAYSNFAEYKSDLVKSFKASPNNGNIEIAIEFTNIPFENKISYLRSNNQINMNFIQKFNSEREYAINHIFENEKLVFNQGKTTAELIYDIFSQSWDTLNYVLKYENDNFSQMSQGKKAFVILTLILEFSKEEKPVIIDQPEDSLDNRSIYKELTMYLKTKKKNRQIILVTHNPNVVIGADAENVIVANQHSTDEPNKNDVQFDYINGAIENTGINDSESAFLYRKGIREHIIEILEGGKEAFTERENKYVSGNKIGR